jgi:hypothetical protein
MPNPVGKGKKNRSSQISKGIGSLIRKVKVKLRWYMVEG